MNKVESVDCDNCVKILQYLYNKDEVDIRELDGHMRTNGITTSVYHLNKHLKPNELIIISKKGLIKKRNYVKITEKGKMVLDDTLEK